MTETTGSDYQLCTADGLAIKKDDPLYWITFV